MEISIYIAGSALLGIIIGWLITKLVLSSRFQAEKEKWTIRHNDLDKEMVLRKATMEADINALQKELSEKGEALEETRQKLIVADHDISEKASRLSEINAKLTAKIETLSEKEEAIQKLETELKEERNNQSNNKDELAKARAYIDAVEEKLVTQKSEMEELNEKFNKEFENIANKILDVKTQKFTDLNKTNLNAILEPLGKNIKEFKDQVEKVYDKEAKERFSLGEKVKELADLNRKISEEANNLTRALKNDSKTQGGWGEMILENILERSGLEKGREYFMEYQLDDPDGVPLRSDSEGKKMRPDALVKYPDNRHVIIDSKMSLNAFTQFLAASDEDEKKKYLEDHLDSIKRHIRNLSEKGYDDYNKALDFVMMFVPSEPAYISAMQADPELWNFAYDKRILLLSPTNLITSLKLIADLWKREYQNLNAQKIAERGAKMYDKFVGFVGNLQDVDKHLNHAHDKFRDAFKQLSTGNDNLVLQATKMKELGLKTKKELPEDMVGTALPDSEGGESSN